MTEKCFRAIPLCQQQQSPAPWKMVGPQHEATSGGLPQQNCRYFVQSTVIHSTVELCPLGYRTGLHVPYSVGGQIFGYSHTRKATSGVEMRHNSLQEYCRMNSSVPQVGWAVVLIRPDRQGRRVFRSLHRVPRYSYVRGSHEETVLASALPRATGGAMHMCPRNLVNCS